MTPQNPNHEPPALPVTGDKPNASAPEAFVDQPDPEFQAMLDEQAGRLARKRKRQSLTVNLTLLAIIAAGGVWYTRSPDLQAKIARLLQSARESGKDFRLMGSMTKEYDKQLEKIGAHSGELDAATRSIGGDSSAASGNEDPNMDKETRQLVGDDAPTTSERNSALKAKFGTVRQLADKKPE